MASSDSFMFIFFQFALWYITEVVRLIIECCLWNRWAQCVFILIAPWCYPVEIMLNVMKNSFSQKKYFTRCVTQNWLPLVTEIPSWWCNLLSTRGMFEVKSNSTFLRNITYLEHLILIAWKLFLKVSSYNLLL